MGVPDTDGAVVRARGDLQPSEEKQADVTRLVCPLNGPEMRDPSWMLHTESVLSFEPDTICIPSLEIPIDVIGFLCALNGSRMCFPSYAFWT